MDAREKSVSSSDSLGELAFTAFALAIRPDCVSGRGTKGSRAALAASRMHLGLL